MSRNGGHRGNIAPKLELLWMSAILAAFVLAFL